MIWLRKVSGYADMRIVRIGSRLLPVPRTTAVKCLPADVSQRHVERGVSQVEDAAGPAEPAAARGDRLDPCRVLADAQRAQFLHF